MHPTAGATAVGARPPLIAFNVNLGTTNLQIAKNIAKGVRESSGGLVNVQALGVDLAEQGMVQVSMNLLDYTRTPIHRAYELVRDRGGAPRRARRGQRDRGPFAPRCPHRRRRLLPAPDRFQARAGARGAAS